MTLEVKPGAKAWEILHYPDPRLAQICEPVERFDSELEDFIHDLEMTRRVVPNTVGIAAPQVGYLKRICIVDGSLTRKPCENRGYTILVNPEITFMQGEEKGREGCLSVPDYTGNVLRASEIHVKAYDMTGKPFEFDSRGFEARIIQHELDHLNGNVFLDRLVSKRKDLFPRKNYS